TDQVDFADVALVAEADELGKSDAVILCVIENGGAEGAALRQKGDFTFGRHLAREGGVQVRRGIGVDHPKAVRADERDAVSGGDFADFSLALDARGAGFAK